MIELRACESDADLELWLDVRRAVHPHDRTSSLAEMRGFMKPDDLRLLAYLDGGTSDALIIVANVDPHSVRETTVHLDLAKIGLAPGSTFGVRDLITGAHFEWETDNYVRLDAVNRSLISQALLSFDDFGYASKIIGTNFVSAVSLLIPLANHFESQGHGHLAAITSVAGDYRGGTLTTRSPRAILFGRRR